MNIGTMLDSIIITVIIFVSDPVRAIITVSLLNHDQRFHALLEARVQQRLPLRNEIIKQHTY